MKIGLDATAIPLKRMGAGVYTFQLIQALAKIDLTNKYYIFAQQEHINQLKINQPNFHFITVNASSRPLRLLWEQTLLPLQISQHRIDVLHSPHYTMPGIKACKSVVTFHDMTFQLFPEMHEKSKRIFFQTMMRLSASHADKLISVSHSTSLDLIRLLNVHPSKISVISSAANPIYRQLLSDEVEKVCHLYNLIKNNYLLFVGALEPRKNIPILIRAYSKLVAHFPEIPLVIVGKKGWMYESIFELVVSLDIQNKVIFLGYVPESDLVSLYNGARLFVYPSAYEGFGFPVLEAMQCGTPVITSNISSMPELAADAAILVEPGDVEGLFNSIKLLLSDNKLSKQLSKLGLARSANFTWFRTAKETIDTYQELFRK